MTASSRENLPAISVIVPTYERFGRIRRCIAALADVEYPSDRFEVLLVDDGAREPLRDIIDTNGVSVPLRIVRQPHSGPAAARNLGAREAQHPWLAFLDDDCVPRTGWLRALARCFTASPDRAVSGQTVNAIGRNSYSMASQILVDYLRDYYKHPVAGERFVTSSNLAFPAAAFRAIGGFDTRFPRAGGEDRELCDRWIQDGREIQYADDAIVDHYHEMSLASFWRQHVNYGRGAYEFRQARRRRKADPVPIEPLSFYLGLVQRPSRECPGRPSLTVLTIVSQVANATGFFVEALSSRAGARGRGLAR